MMLELFGQLPGIAGMDGVPPVYGISAHGGLIHRKAPVRRLGHIRPIRDTSRSSVDSDTIINPARAVRPAIRPMRGRQAPASRVEPGTAIRATWTLVLGSPGLNADATTELQDHSVLREMPCGALLISRRDSARDLVLLARGNAALGAAQDDAPFRPERTVHGPEWLDASSAWLGGTHAQDALALTDVQLVSVPRVAVQQVLLRHPELARRLVLALSRQVHALTEVAHDLMHKDAETRFTAWLLHRCVADASVPGTAVVALHERKRDIAAQLGITPETLSRLLRHLSRKGLIEVRGYTVRVLDLAALEGLAGS